MKNNKIIFVQGLGVIGSINAYCIAYKKKYFDVVGFESKNKIGKNIIKKINSGFFPFNSSDKKLNFITKKVNKNNNLFVTNNYDSIKKKPDIIICSLALTIVSRGDLAPTSSVLDTVEEKNEDTPSIPEDN